MTSSDSSTAAVPVQVKLLRPGARMPARGTEFATGWDLHACVERDVRISQVPVVVPTGIAIAVPAGWDAQVRPRSGLARRGVLCTFGTVDADYRGELLVTLYTTSPVIQHTIHNGDRIGQLVISQVASPAFEQVSELDETARGAGGHGSTGR